MTAKIITSNNNLNNTFYQFLPQGNDEQFQIGMKIMLMAYENRSKDYQKEILDLNDKVSFLENKLNSSKDEFVRLNEEISRVVNENKYLLGLAQSLSKSNKQLENFKFSIMGSLENESIGKKDNNQEFINDSFFNKIKFNIPKTSEFMATTTTAYSLPNQKQKISTENFSQINSNRNNDDVDEILNSKYDKIKEKTITSLNSSRCVEQSKLKKASVEEKINILRGKLRKTTKEPHLSHQFSDSLSNIPKQSYQPIVEAEENFNRSNINKSSQYILSGKFFSECRTLLKKEDNLRLLETLKKCNNNEISKDDAYDIIRDLLEPYPQLQSDFQTIFT